ncbi:MAG: TolC family protein [Candidatus Omnitrophota bacterium]
MNYKKILIILVVACFLYMRSGSCYAKVRIGERKKQLREAEIYIGKEISTDVLEGLTLNDYIRLGLGNNPGLKARFYQWKFSFRKITEAFSLPDPQFTYTNYIEEVETRVGPQESAFSIAQKFPLPDKLWLRKSKAFSASEEVFYEFEKSRLGLIYNITDAYYEYLYLGKEILLTKENIKLLKNIESVAQAKYKAALTKNQDLLKVQVELGRLENNLYSLKDLRKPLAARLNALLNFPVDTVLPWPNDSLEDAVMDDKYTAVDELYYTFRQNNPDILALSQNVEKNRDALKLAKREFFPDLTVAVTRIVTADALNSSVVDSGKDPLMVMFSVNVPIWFSRLNAGVEDARASMKAAESLLESKENELLSKLALVHYKMRDSLRQSYLYKDALLPKAAQALNATQSGYEGGGVDFLSLIDAQRVLLNFQSAYYRQNANFYQRLAELKSLLGELQANKEW